MRHAYPVLVMLAVGLPLVIVGCVVIFPRLIVKRRRFLPAVDCVITDPLRIEELRLKGETDRLKAENDIRAALLQALAGLAVLGGALGTWLQLDITSTAARRQLALSREEQLTERLTHALDQLGSARLELRLGGIYALERIGHESNRDRAAVVEILTAFVREHAGGTSAAASVAPDVQATLKVLGRRTLVPGERLDLRGVDIPGADFRRAELAHANLSGARLTQADLKGAQLAHANLSGARLEGAVLSAARLPGAWLHLVHLQGASLDGAFLEKAQLPHARLDRANLDRADLTGAILYGASLENANLGDARLDGVNLAKARLMGANLRGAHLAGADLRSSVGLTPEQLAGAIVDASTKLPAM